MTNCCADYDPLDLYCPHYRVARKKYTCCECGIDINPGDTYERLTTFGGGIWVEFKTCEPCADLRESLIDVACPILEGLADIYTEYLLDTGLNVKPGTHAARLAGIITHKEDLSYE